MKPKQGWSPEMREYLRAMTSGETPQSVPVQVSVEPAPLEPFGGYELALGAVYGVRWFGVDKYGRLRGRSYDHIWTPGENVARCRANDASAYRGLTFTYLLHTASWGGGVSCSCPMCRPPSQQAIEGRVEIKHDVPSDYCGCGFYAYAENCDDGSFGPKQSNPCVLGIIEGYGRTVIGTKGFRTEKARIVGLRTNDAMVRALYPDVEFYDTKRNLFDAFDVVQRHVPTPESDSDFWTRP